MIENKEIKVIEEQAKGLVMSFEELQVELKKVKEALLSGKCPIKIMEKDGKINWDYNVIREGFNSREEVYKYLTATTDAELARDIISNGVCALLDQKSSAERYNLVLQTLADSEPKDATEAKLCLQAHALYTQGMKYLSLAECNDMIPQIEFSLKNAVKLLRLHNETIEALSKYRRGGTQNVVVQHVQVNDGGRAIVGNMIARGG